MTFVTMILVILTLALPTLSGGSNCILHLDGLRTAIFVKGRRSWSSCVDICRENYTDLVTIYDQRENEIILDFCKNKTPNCAIGLKNNNDKPTFKWSNGDPYNYTKTTANVTNICVGMTKNGSWESLNCTQQKPFICYSDEPVNSSRYHLITELKNWYDAVNYCRENFTDLVSIRNDEQNSEVLNAQKNHSDSCWIGLMRDNWEWSDKGQSLYRDWLDSHPKMENNVTTFSQEKWKTFGTNTNSQAICYKDHIHISNESMTWEESLDYCRGLDGFFCILTKREQIAAERLMRRLSITEPVWVGLEQNSLFGFWVWTTGVTVDWNNWEDGQSPRLPLSHHCGALRSTEDDFKWKDMNCRTKLRALCFDWAVSVNNDCN